MESSLDREIASSPERRAARSKLLALTTARWGNLSVKTTSWDRDVDGTRGAVSSKAARRREPGGSAVSREGRDVDGCAEVGLTR
jgi:hypothetical protein